MRSIAELCAVAAAFGIIGTVNAADSGAVERLGRDVVIQRRLCVNPATKLLPIRGASSGH